MGASPEDSLGRSGGAGGEGGSLVHLAGEASVEGGPGSPGGGLAKRRLSLKSARKKMKGLQVLSRGWMMPKGK